MVDNDEPNCLAGNAKTSGSKNDPKYSGWVWESPADKERHHIVLTSFMRPKYEPIAVDEECVA